MINTLAVALCAALVAILVASVLASLWGLKQFKPFERIVSYDALGNRNDRDRMVILRPTVTIGAMAIGGIACVATRSIEPDVLTFILFGLILWTGWGLISQVWMIIVASNQKQRVHDGSANPSDVADG